MSILEARFWKYMAQLNYHVKRITPFKSRFSTESERGEGGITCVYLYLDHRYSKSIKIIINILKNIQQFSYFSLSSFIYDIKIINIFRISSWGSASCVAVRMKKNNFKEKKEKMVLFSLCWPMGFPKNHPIWFSRLARYN